MKKIIVALLMILSVNLSAQSKNPHVVLETNQGNIELELFPEVAPLAVENFTTHVKNGYYNGLIFHRIIKDFMIQGGDPSGTGRGGESIWKKDFKDEFTNKMFERAGVLAMANRGSHTNGSQFFITTAPTPWLNGRHTIFGQVTAQSMSVVKKLNDVATLGQNSGDRPVEEQKIIKAYIKK
ncbi:MAG: peptidylprolyl isomerase [Sulfurimonas sp. RIFCSPHIGHO2_12_FULL_36_9]|uniref:peptidylprolyl isomerase n=1 Tax=unclassified Sulfurimonas TaxID=2623549 RepID=UPI0008CB21C4|nr:MULTISPECIES: peptidylprolyl isomerase [unclassified Sulfurimonas]OHD97801.1 MAG: peptidylprolyl isomerase [Sulfurimonas sp. RIFCSPHIGHO2_12_FULL_36_9]OHE01172.1 MAG: peptidylprolyl isomerase [Sulfurimonas sp. RIFCSPLOWO2_12_36_12]